MTITAHHPCHCGGRCGGDCDGRCGGDRGGHSGGCSGHDRHRSAAPAEGHRGVRLRSSLNLTPRPRSGGPCIADGPVSTPRLDWWAARMAAPADPARLEAHRPEVRRPESHWGLTPTGALPAAATTILRPRPTRGSTEEFSTVLRPGIVPGGPDPHRDSLRVRDLIRPPAATRIEPPAAIASTDPGAPGSPLLTLQWRDVSVTVPQRWYLDYLSVVDELRAEGSNGARGPVSSVSMATSLLWSNFISAASAAGAVGSSARSTWQDMLVCTNLPRDDYAATATAHGTPPMFWMSGWGAPLEVFINVQRMIRTYAGFVQDTVSSSTRCEGFGDWIRDACMGAASVGFDEDSGTCRVGFSYRNADRATAWSPVTGTALYGHACSEATAVGSCGSGFDIADGDPGNPWDEWTAVWNERTQTFLPDPPAISGGPATASTLAAWADVQVQILNFHPIVLAWEGFLCDYLMFLARLSLDYARSISDTATASHVASIMDSARRFARFALRIIVQDAGLHIHEYGHVYADKGHCESANDCCFEFAAHVFRCGVIQALGLPPDVSSGPYDGILTGNLISNASAICHVTKDPTADDASTETWCQLDDVGVPGGGGFFCAFPCDGDRDLTCVELP